MSMIEAAQRIKSLGKRILFFGPASGAVIWLLSWLIFRRIGIGELVVLVSFPAILGAGFWLITWIIEAFLPREFH
jgi:hypothetical protein